MRLIDLSLQLQRPVIVRQAWLVQFQALESNPDSIMFLLSVQ